MNKRVLKKKVPQKDERRQLHRTIPEVKSFIVHLPAGSICLLPAIFKKITCSALKFTAKEDGKKGVVPFMLWILISP